MNKDKMISILCLSGMLALIFYVLHDIIGAMNYPNYDWLSQAVSDLTASTAPSREVAGGLANAYGVFSVLSWVLLSVYFSDKLTKPGRLGIYLFACLNIISAVGYGLFPLSEAGAPETFQDIMHIYVVTISVVLLSISSLVLLVIGGIRNGKDRLLGITAAITLALMMIGAIGSNVVPTTIFGLFERFSTYSVVIFTGFISVYVFSLTNHKHGENSRNNL